MDRMGHHQIQTTQKYLHALPEADRKNLDVLVGEVHGRLRVGAQIEDGLLDRGEAPGERPLHLIERGAPVLLPLRGDQLLHGLGLSQIEPAGQEGAQREFSGARRPGAAVQEDADQTVDQRGRGGEMELDGIFAGVGAGTATEDGPGKAARDLDGPRPAQADDGAQAASGRRGKGDDGLGVTGQNS